MSTSMVSLIPIGVALANILLRLSGYSDAADILGDAGAGATHALSLRPINAEARRMARAIATELEQEVGHLSVDSEGATDLQAVAGDVGHLLNDLAQDHYAIVEAVKRPEEFHEFLMRRGGNRIIREAPLSAETFAHKVLVAVSDCFVAYAPDSPRFPRAALQDLVVTVHSEARKTDLRMEQLEKALVALAPSPSLHSSAEICQALATHRSSILTTVGDTGGAVVRRERLLALVSDQPKRQIAFIGDGGTGKSVLAAQIAKSEALREVVLASCATLDGTEQLLSPEQIDMALGEQATELSVSVSDILEAFGTRPLLIVDTLDIILREETAAPISKLLLGWAKRADVLLTCRAREWRDLLEPVRPEFETHMMPTLTAEEVLRWSAAYATHDGVPPTMIESFKKSLESALQEGGTLRVLAVPLRLAMATSLYAPAGALPSGLTATRLYNEYWDRRVRTARDGRKNTKAARATESAAIDIAGSIWRQSLERFAEDVVFQGEPRGLNSLLSEGVVVEVGMRIRFFHQTFAEFAVARLLAASGTIEDFDRLRQGLKAQRSGYWGVASHLVLEELGDIRFEEILDSVPDDTVEGVRVIVEGLLARPNISMATSRLNRLALDHPEHLAAAADLLQSAPPEHALCASRLLCDLAEREIGSLTAEARAVANLLQSLPDAESTQVLGTFFKILALRRRSGDDRVASESRRLVEAVLPSKKPVNVALLATAISAYASLPSPGRLAVIRATQDAVDRETRSALISQAVLREVPPGAVDALASLVAEEFSDPSCGNPHWRTWSDLLGSALPTRWDSVQVRVLAVLAKDAVIRSELLAEALAPSIRERRDIAINALRYIVVSDPRGFAATLGDWSGPTDATAANAYAKLASQIQDEEIDDEKRALIVGHLVDMADASPLPVWATAAKLAAPSHQLVSTVVHGLRSRYDAAYPQSWQAKTLDEVEEVLRRADTDPADITLLEQLRTSSGLVRGEKARRAVEERVLRTPWHPSAQAFLDTLIDSNRKRDQRSAMKRLVSSRQDWPGDSWQRALPWLVPLCRVKTPGVAVALLRTLRDDVASEHWTADETEVIAAKLARALTEEDDLQVSETAISIIAGVIHAGGSHALPSKERVESLGANLVSGFNVEAIVANKDRASGLYGQYVDFLTTVAMTVPGPEHTARLVGDLLKTTDIGTLSGRTRKRLTSALASVLRTDPSWWNQVERLWPTVPPANRAAIADLALSGLVPDRGTVAESLARRPDCPPDVAADIHRRLRA